MLILHNVHFISLDTTEYESTTSNDYINTADDYRDDMQTELMKKFKDNSTGGSTAYVGSESNQIYNETMEVDVNAGINDTTVTATILFVILLSALILLATSIAAVIITAFSFKYFRSSRPRHSSLNNPLLQNEMVGPIEGSISTKPNVAYILTVQENADESYTSMVYNPLYPRHTPNSNEKNEHIYDSVRKL